MGSIKGALAFGELVGMPIRLSTIVFYARLLPTLARAKRSTTHEHVNVPPAHCQFGSNRILIRFLGR